MVELRFYFVDDDLASSRHTVYLLLASLGSAFAFARAYAALITGMTDGALIRINIITTYQDQDSPKGAPGSDLHRVGVFSFDTDNTPPGLYVLTIPALIEAAILSSGALAGVAIDTTQSAVAAFVAASTAGGAIYPVAPWDAGGLAGAGDELSYTGAALIALRSAYVGETP